MTLEKHFPMSSRKCKSVHNEVKYLIKPHLNIYILDYGKSTFIVFEDFASLHALFHVTIFFAKHPRLFKPPRLLERWKYFLIFFDFNARKFLSWRRIWKQMRLRIGFYSIVLFLFPSALCNNRKYQKVIDLEFSSQFHYISIYVFIS